MLKGKCYSCAIICAISQAAILQTAFAADQIFRVDRVNGSSTGDGSAWGSSAYRYLQEAIEDAAAWISLDPINNSAQIWVAAGTYKPNEFEGTVSNCPGTSHQRCYSFQMHDNVRWYGGFEGDETDRNQRAPLVNITILSGDIDGDNITDAGNSYHVVTADRVDATAIIDGFHVIRGYAVDAPAPETGIPPGGGGGLLIIGAAGFSGPGSTPILLRLVFNNNTAKFGGAVFICTGQAPIGPQFYNCEFRNNMADGGTTASDGVGGAVRVLARTVSEASAGVTVRFFNTLFASNEATSSGGAVHIGLYDAGTFFNCTIAYNEAGEYGGGVYSVITVPCDENETDGGASFYNSIVWGNSAAQGTSELLQVYGTRIFIHSCVQSLSFQQACDEASTSNSPQFVNAPSDLHLLCGSSAVNTGTLDGARADLFDLNQDGSISGKCPDLDLHARLVGSDANGPLVDML